MRVIVLTVVLAATLPECASGQDMGGYGQICDRPIGVDLVKLRSDLPPALRDEFENVAMPGEHWNGGDVGPPGTGLTLVWHRGKRWVVIEGHGGFVTWIGVRAFDVSDEGRHFSEIKPTAQPMDRSMRLCEQAENYIRS